MKYLAFCALILVFACSDSKSTDQKTLSSNSSTENKSDNNTASASADDGIVGEWELAGVTGDDNGNDQLEPEERSKASTNGIDYMKLNNDGSAAFFCI